MFKKHKFKIFIISASLVAILLIVAKFMGAFQFAILPTEGSEPTIKKGSWVFFSSALPYEKYKILAFKQKNIDHPLGNYTQRLVGIEGDKIQIKDGNLFVNDRSVDSEFNLKLSYVVDRAFVNELVSKGFNFEEDFYPYDENHFVTNLTKEDLNNNFYFKRFVNNNKEELISETFGKEWTPDNFGPVIVPANKLFFLGDNRNASLDSRYYGFVDKEDVIGKVFYPKN